MKAAIIIFPGTNREQDMKHALELAGFQTEFLHCQDKALPDNTDLVVLPGGFSYGDYLRTGAMSAVTQLWIASKNLQRMAEKFWVSVMVSKSYVKLDYCQVF